MHFPGDSGIVRLRSISKRQPRAVHPHPAPIAETGEPDSLTACFARVVAAHPTRPALGSGAWQPTYRELDAAANRLAQALIRAATPGDRVALLMDHDGPQIAASIAALKAGGIVVVLSPEDPPDRLRQTLDHAEPALIVTDGAHRALAEEVARHGCGLIAYEDAAASGPSRDPAVALAPDDAAFLVYTSGSTGRPKAVVRTHGLVLQNAIRHSHGLAIQPDDRVALLAALSSGQGVGTLWTVLRAGAALCPFPVATRGLATLGGWMRERAITTYISSASMFRSFTKTLDAGARFDGMRAVRVASEMATADDLRAFRAHFPPACRFVHSFGCSEVGNVAQLVLARDDTAAEGRLPVGPPAADLEVDVVDENGSAVPRGEIGTLVIKGRHLAAGYWRDPALTAERFTVPDASGLRSFRSGDRGRIDHRGWLELAGRADAQVKIRGQRVETTEVEAAMLRLAGVARVTVCALPSPDGTTRLVSYVVAQGTEGISPVRLRRALRAALPDHMVPTAFIAVRDFPLTPHGKIDRARLLAQHPPAVAHEAAEPLRGDTEALVAAIWARTFGLPAVGRHDDFFVLGGDSLAAAVVGARIYDALGVELGLTAFSSHPTLAALSAAVDVLRAASTPAGPPLVRAARDRPLPLSFTQERIWTYSQPPGEVAAYLDTKRFVIRGALDRAALRGAIAAVQQRHELLRTAFVMVDGRPAQIARDLPDADLPFIDVVGSPDPVALAEALFAEEARKIHDLARPPLMRFALARLGADEHLLFRVKHHLLGDGQSSEIHMRELARAYAALRRAEALPAPDPSRLQYADYAAWQRQVMQPATPAYRAVVDWWRARLDGLWPAFTPRFRRPQQVAGLDPALGDIERALDRETSSRLDDLARDSGTTTYMIGLAAFSAVLAAETGGPRVVIGSYISGRNRTALQDMLGDFTSLVPLGLDCPLDAPFRAWLAAVRGSVTETVARAALPYEQLAAALAGTRIPEIGVIFAARYRPTIERFADLEFLPREDRSITMGWGLTVRCTESEAEQVYKAHFDAGLYDPSGVGAMLERLLRFLAAAARAPDETLRALLAA